MSYEYRFSILRIFQPGDTHWYLTTTQQLPYVRLGKLPKCYPFNYDANATVKSISLSYSGRRFRLNQLNKIQYLSNESFNIKQSKNST